MDPEAGAALSMQQSPDTKFARDAMAAFPYRQLIGSLMYLMVATRPDLAFSTAQGGAHWEAACKVLGYLRQTADVGFLYTREAQFQAQHICGATFACHINDRDRNYVFMMAFIRGLDVEASKAFDLSALPLDSPSRCRGSQPP